MLYEYVHIVSRAYRLQLVLYNFLVGYGGHTFSYVAHFVFLRDVWIRTQSAAVSSRRVTNLATHLSKAFNGKNQKQNVPRRLFIPALQ